MSRFLIGYVSALLVMVGIDMIWLKTSFASIYAPVMQPLMAPHTRLAPVAAFYLIYPLGLLFFAIAPSQGWPGVLLRGALFGFFAYLTYDLTNFGTLKGWTLNLSLIDVAWGTVLSGVVATASYLITNAMAARSL